MQLYVCTGKTPKRSTAKCANRGKCLPAFTRSRFIPRTVTYVRQERGRPALSQNLYDDVLAYFEEDPRRGTNDADRWLNISQSCAWKIINKAGLHPYHYRKSQELTPMDFFLWSEIKRRVHRSERIRLE